MSSKESRLILACAAGPLNQAVTNGQGALLRMDAAAVRQMLQDVCGLWIGPRGQLEEQPLFRQIIPYVVVKVGEFFLRYRRTAAGGEQRLHDQGSIGFGGHVELVDVCLSQGKIQLMVTLDSAACREMAEELQLIAESSSEQAILGLLVDQSNAVGRVHVGVVEVWQVPSIDGLVGSCADGIGEVELKTLQQLFDDRENLESWSKLLVEQLYYRDHPPIS